MLDSDSNGQLTFEEFEEGLKKLTHDFEEQDQILSLTSDEFNILTTRPDGGTYLSDEGALPAEAWEAMIRAQLAFYVQRQLAFGSLWEAASTADTNTCSCMQAVLHALQLLMLKTEFTPQTAAMCAQIHDRTNPESIFTPIASKRPYSQALAKNAAATAAEDVPLNISASFRATDERIERIENIISGMSDKVDKALSYLEGENAKNGGDDHTGFADWPQATFRSPSIMSLRTALGLGVPGSGGGGGVILSGDNAKGSETTARDTLASNVSSKSPRLLLSSKSPRLLVPRTAEEAWKHKVEACRKRRELRAPSILESSVSLTHEKRIPLLPDCEIEQGDTKRHAVSPAAGEDLRRHAGGLLEETRGGSPQDLRRAQPKSIEINNTHAQSVRTADSRPPSAVMQTSYMPKGFFTQGAFTR
jgi:hypothetical protein